DQSGLRRLLPRGCHRHSLALSGPRWRVRALAPPARADAGVLTGLARQGRSARGGDSPPALTTTPLPPHTLRYSLVGYFGGRTVCRIRRVPVPVAYLDFASAHPTVCALLGASRFLRCDHVDVIEEDPAKVARWLARLSLDDCFDPKLWRKLCGFALVQPQG